jgi:transcription antitermination factor NusG
MLTQWGKKLGKQLMKPRSKFKPEVDTTRWNIVKGDTVKVIQGPQTGGQGKILQVLRKDNRVIIEGVNMVSYKNLFIVLYINNTS